MQGSFEEEQAALPCSRRLSQELLEHSCQHAQLGPFRKVVPGFVAGAIAPDISRTHTTYHVLEVPLQGGRARLAFRPSRPGEHAVFVLPEQEVELRLQGVNTQETRRHEQAVPACAELSRGHVFDLARGREYELEVFLPPPEQSSEGEAIQLSLFIEHLGTYEPAWDDECGDF